MITSRVSQVFMKPEILNLITKKAFDLYGTFTCLGFLLGKRQSYPSGLIQDLTIENVDIPKQNGTLVQAEIDPMETAIFLQTLKKNNRLDEFLGLFLFMGNRILSYSSMFNNSLENMKDIIQEPMIGVKVNHNKECNLTLRIDLASDPCWYAKPFQPK